MAREYGPKNVHVSHVIVDGLIESDTALEFLGMPKGSRFPDGSVRLLSIPQTRSLRLLLTASFYRVDTSAQALLPPQMAKTWLFLAQQHPSAWTFEMDLRPAREHW